MRKEIATSDAARLAMLRGIDTMAETVAVTFGPRGRNVMMRDEVGRIKPTKDGVTVARAVSMPDPFEDIGIKIVREAAMKCNDEAGDGSTTATILAASLVREGMKLAGTGMNPMRLRRGMEWAGSMVIRKLEQMRKNIAAESEIATVGRLAANGDEEIGRLLAQAFTEVGTDGVVSFEESKKRESGIEVRMGMSFDRGLLSGGFIRDAAKQAVEFEQCVVLLLEQTLSDIKPMLDLLEVIRKSGSPLLVLAESVEGDALATLIINNGEGKLPCAAVKAPGFGDRRTDMMEDLAILTGATYITEDMGMDLASIDKSHLGVAENVRITRTETVITGGWGERDDSADPAPHTVEGRVKAIRAEMAETESEYYKDRLRERIARLTSGIALLLVGGVTETEVRERKDRVEDALNSVKGALADGLVLGGGQALLSAVTDNALLKGARNFLEIKPGDQGWDIKEVRDTAEFIRTSWSEDFECGIRIVQEGMKEPMRIIAENAGRNGDYVVESVERMLSADRCVGFNALTGKLENLDKAGVMDPFKVVKNAVQAAVSTASLLLTTETVIARIQEEGDESFEHAVRHPY